MSLALHGHHVLLIATLAFVAAALTPNWYTKPDDNIELNVFQICQTSSTSKTCEWIFNSQSNNILSDKIKIVYPTLTASFAIICGGISLIALILGSYYIHQYASGNGSTWLLISTMFATFFSFLFSCGVWTTMLTTNLQQKALGTSDISLNNFGFSFWINIGSSGVYLYALLIYLIAICKS